MVKNIVHLPQELIIDILLRLPVKTLLRFRCVSKSWFSLISDPDFAKSHFQLAASRTHRLVYLDPKAPRTLDFDDNLADASLSLYFWRSRDCPKIGGSCRGFLFLHNCGHFYLWNPSTGAYKQIPESRRAVGHNNNHLYMFMYGFTYDPSTDDYLVVLGSYIFDIDDAPISNPIKLEIFSLRSHQWKQIKVGSRRLPYRYPLHASEGGPRVELPFNGAIHWLVCNDDTSRDVVISFDLKEKSVEEINLPDVFDNSIESISRIESGLLVFDGFLSVWMVEMDSVQVWVMKEYTIHASWTKTFDFSMHPVPEFSPVFFTNDGDVVGSDGRGGLVKFNDKGQLLKHHSHHNSFTYISQMTVYTESLLSHSDGGWCGWP